MGKRIRYGLFLAIITPLCFELALRILGYSAYQQIEYTLESSPKNCLTASNTLGFSLGNGAYRVSVNGAPTYTTTHVHGKRVTRFHKISKPRGKIFVMGCSFTYGMGVDDSLSFPFQLQTHFRQMDIQNFGVPGYGNVQSLLQLEKEIESGNIPEIVVLNFCDFHHERNSLTPRFRNSLVMGYERSNSEAPAALRKSKFPMILGRSIQTIPYNELYSNWTGRELFASVNYLQTMSDERRTSAINLEQNSENVLSKIHILCKHHGISFIVTGLTRNPATQRFLSNLSEKGIENYDISLNLKLKKYNQLPYDTHPNARAHHHFAKKLIPIITKTLNSQSLAS